MPSDVMNIELRLTPNDREVTCSWRVRHRPVGRTSMKAADLADCSDRVRKALSNINAYIRTNIYLSEELDKDFASSRSRVGDFSRF
jgi:hypothetical protein